MTTLRIFDIVWDHECPETDLPTEVFVTDEILNDREPADYLSDEYGWCVEELDVEELSEAESLAVMSKTHWV